MSDQLQGGYKTENYGDLNYEYLTGLEKKVVPAFPPEYFMSVVGSQLRAGSKDEANRQAMVAMMKMGARSPFLNMLGFGLDETKIGSKKEKFPKATSGANFVTNFGNVCTQVASVGIREGVITKGKDRLSGIFDEASRNLQLLRLADVREIRGGMPQLELTPGGVLVTDAIKEHGGARRVTGEHKLIAFVANEYYNGAQSEQAIAERFNRIASKDEQTNRQKVTDIRMRAACLNPDTGKMVDGFNPDQPGKNPEIHAKFCGDCPLLGICGNVIANSSLRMGNKAEMGVLAAEVQIELDAIRTSLLAK